MITVALIGCGEFVRKTHLANLLADGRFRIRAAVDLDSTAARSIAEQSHAAYWTTDPGQALADPEVDLVFIATPHHTHAALSIQAAKAGKHVFCEKPMGLHEEECQAVAKAVQEAGVLYMVGHNRAYAPFTQTIVHLLRRLQAPMLIYHRVADWNPYSHGWLLDESLSGGRVIGEGSHLADLMCQFTGQNPRRIYAEGGNFAEPSPTSAPDSVLFTVGFSDGSAGVAFISSVANNAFPKEEIQITCANHTIVLSNFQFLDIYAPEGKQSFSLPAIDKGHRNELDALARAILHGEPTLTGLEEALRAAQCTFAAVQAVRTHQVQNL